MTALRSFVGLDFIVETQQKGNVFSALASKTVHAGSVLYRPIRYGDEGIDRKLILFPAFQPSRFVGGLWD